MKEFEAKVRLNEENGGKTGELDIMSPPPFDNGYFNGVTFGITFKEPVFEALKEEKICPVYSDNEVKQPCANCLECELERPHGEWEALGFQQGYAFCRCSNCHKTTRLYRDSKNEFCCIADIRKKVVFCMYCGSDNRKKEDEPHGS